MNRLLSQVPRMPRWMPRWRHLRWVACAAIVPALWACNSRRLATPTPLPAVIDARTFKQTVNHQLDLLVMVDNSSSMNPLQTKMSAQLPTFLNALKDQSTGQYPDLHVAVVSSSFGGGAWGNVNQCASGSHPGDDQGNFQQGPGGAGAGSCGMLHSGETYLKNGDGTSTNPPNFDGGDIGAVFQCMALLGDSGCGFESQFESVYYALAKALLQKGTPDQDGDGMHDSHNGGFLRDNAVLAVVMLTNEDDCSVSSDSLLLDPGVNSATDPLGLGALQSYRCNEFGHLCDGQPPPHGYDFNSNPPAFNLATGTYRTPTGPGMGGVMLKNCVSEEGMGKTDPLLRAPNGNPDPTNGHLYPTVAMFSNFIVSLKANPDDVLVAAIAGPVADDSGNSLYRVFASQNPAANNELDPVVDHSCVQATTDSLKPEYADPAVRIQQWTTSFGPNGVFYPICANDFAMAMTAIGNKIHQKLGASCVSTIIAADPNDPTKHNCQVTQKITDSGGKVTTSPLAECDTNIDNAPCFQLVPNSGQCNDPTAKTLFKVCNEQACMAMTQSTEMKDASIACSVQ